MFIRALFISFFTICLPAACTRAPGKPLTLSLNDGSPPIAAMFETRIEESDHHGKHGGSEVRPWRFWRLADRIETLETEGNTGEAWSRSPDLQISYERIFHADKQVIEYTPGDLKALGGEPDWRVLASLVDTRLLHRLRPEGNAEVLGRQATRFIGESRDGSMEIWWLEKERLPAMIKRTSAERTQTTVLTEIHELSESPMPPGRRDEYRYTDYADIGDKENDPFVKSVLHQIKGGHTHTH